MGGGGDVTWLEVCMGRMVEGRLEDRQAGVMIDAITARRMLCVRIEGMEGK